MKRSWEEVKVWTCERPGEITDEGSGPVIVEAPGLKRSWRKAETWQHVARSESLKSWWSAHLQRYFGAISTLGEDAKNSRSCWVEAAWTDETLCVLPMVEVVIWSPWRSPGNPENCAHTELLTLLDFSFALICYNCALAFPFWKKVEFCSFVCFGFLFLFLARSLEFYRLWNFRDRIF